MTIYGYLNKGALCRLDRQDVVRVALNGPWRLTRANKTHSYFKRGRGGQPRLHRWLLGVTDKHTQVDHINGDTTDNRRSNLRQASHQQNMMNRGQSAHNTSGAKGVSWCARTGSWRAAITHNGKFKHLGRFPTKERASAAYEQAASELFGEWKRTNKEAENG